MKNIVTDFGADPTGVSDSTTAIQNALNSGQGKIVCPTGIYLISSSINVSYAGQTLFAEARGAVTFISSAMGSTFTFSGNPVDFEMYNLSLTRTTTATSGQNAIDTTGCSPTDFFTFDNLVINNHWNAFNLGQTGYSFIKKCYLQENYSDAIVMQATPGNGAFGWNIKDMLVELNDGYAMVLKGAASGSGSYNLGEWINFSSFANKSGGIAVFGNAYTSFNSVRMRGGFLGQDGNTGLILDTYAGSSHNIEGVYTELAGTLACGRGQATPATNTGYGIFVSANNTQTNLGKIVCRGHSLSGMYLTGSQMTIIGCEATYNGSAGVSANQNGIYLAGGRAIITGGNYSNNQYGMVISNDNHIICNNNLYPNTLAPYYAGVGFTKTQFLGNLTS